MQNWLNIGPSIEQNDTCLVAFSAFPISDSKLYQNPSSSFEIRHGADLLSPVMFLLQVMCSNCCICLYYEICQLEIEYRQCGVQLATCLMAVCHSVYCG